MDNLKYLEHVVELGKVQAATTPEEMSGAFGAFNGFLGLYYDLAKMELQKAGIDTPPIRNFAIDKALARIDARLDCADFTIPVLRIFKLPYKELRRVHRVLLPKWIYLQSLHNRGRLGR